MPDTSLASKQSSELGSTWKSKNSLRLIDIRNPSKVSSFSDKIQFHSESHDTELDDDCFIIGLNNINIPFKNLDSFEILQNVDLKYFFTRCRDALKRIYDLEFKQSKEFKDLKRHLRTYELER